jgi:hypothetical protein|tara:strand:- start:2869 stop:3165 length:297 start_codon:yes stop_codon:yes gene_type:complete
MKIHIWIKKEELFNGKITEYHTQNLPDYGYDPAKYINISLTADEFFKLEDDLDLDYTMTDLEERIYKESQSITGGEFSNWYNGLTEKEIKTYKKIYDH